jgi:hypothetical protein
MHYDVFASVNPKLENEHSHSLLFRRIFFFASFLFYKIMQKNSYPLGYQSMRPRSAPWRLSVVICLLFTWLSVFIVGHCSDEAGYTDNGTGVYGYQQLYSTNNYDSSNADENSSIDDDTLVIEIRWCGSRPLYLMWVASMLITGLAAAYCSVIGYIKCRDFAVANSRSQPSMLASSTDAGDGSGVSMGMPATHKSDYYISLQNSTVSSSHHSQYYYNMNGGGYQSSVVSGSDNSQNNNINNNNGRQRHSSSQQPTIYQADGTPQFWGSHIYRPTQAAVAVTSR